MEVELVEWWEEEEMLVVVMVKKVENWSLEKKNVVVWVIIGGW